MTEPTQTANNATNKVEAINIAKKLHEIMMTPEMEAIDPNIRHKMVVQKYPYFAQAYPIVLRYIAIDRVFNAKAFSYFLDKMWKDPGKGMEGFIWHQANYAKLLYIENQKAAHKHWSPAVAQRVFAGEHKHMHSHLRKMELEEKRAKNEFAEEKEENLAARRAEFLDYVLSQPETDEELTPEEQEVQRAALGLAPTTPVMSLGDIKVDELAADDLATFYRELLAYARELRDGTPNIFSEVIRDEGSIALDAVPSDWDTERLRSETHLLRDRIETIENRVAAPPAAPVVEKPVQRTRQADSSWLVGTNVAQRAGPRKKRR